MKRRIRRILALVGIVAVLGLIAGTAWLGVPQQTLPEADAALESDLLVEVLDAGGSLTFRPAGPPPEVGLIFYPGAKVPPKAYAPAMRQIAGAGYLVVVPSMPLNHAVFGIDAADAIRRDHPEVQSWAIGGHSLGGAMAAQYIDSHPGQVRALVLWAAYSAADLSDQPIRVLVVYGTLDSGAGTFTSPGNLANLPPAQFTIPLEGGNHANFAWYTGQPNDPPATIAREVQQARAAEATILLLAGFER
jgi:pimeloyl-ACP methyl ester carboxylesterase